MLDSGYNIQDLESWESGFLNPTSKSVLKRLLSILPVSVRTLLSFSTCARYMQLIIDIEYVF